MRTVRALIRRGGRHGREPNQPSRRVSMAPPPMAPHAAASAWSEPSSGLKFLSRFTFTPPKSGNLPMEQEDSLFYRVVPMVESGPADSGDDVTPVLKVCDVINPRFDFLSGPQCSGRDAKHCQRYDGLMHDASSAHLQAVYSVHGSAQLACRHCERSLAFAVVLSNKHVAGRVATVKRGGAQCLEHADAMPLITTEVPEIGGNQGRPGNRHQRWSSDAMRRAGLPLTNGATPRLPKLLLPAALASGLAALALSSVLPRTSLLLVDTAAALVCSYVRSWFTVTPPVEPC